MRVRSLRRKIPWSRKWQPTPLFPPGKFHEQRTLAGYSPKGSQRIGHDGLLSTHSHTHPIGPMLGHHCREFSQDSYEMNAYQSFFTDEKAQAQGS